MKQVNVTYSQQGKIVSADNTNVFFEGEDNSIKICAAFPSDLTIDSVTAYIHSMSGRQDVVTPTLTDGKYCVILTDEQVEKGLLRVGFEVKSGMEVSRYAPVMLDIDGFISDDYVVANKLYTVSVNVDSIQTTDPNTLATVENVGNSKEVRLKFSIPKGDSGLPGQPGVKGDKGDTPVKGIDYWTSADQDEIKSYVTSAILNGRW